MNAETRRKLESSIEFKKRLIAARRETIEFLELQIAPLQQMVDTGERRLEKDRLKREKEVCQGK